MINIWLLTNFDWLISFLALNSWKKVYFNIFWVYFFMSMAWMTPGAHPWSGELYEQKRRWFSSSLCEKKLKSIWSTGSESDLGCWLTKIGRLTSNHCWSPFISREVVFILDLYFPLYLNLYFELNSFWISFLRWISILGRSITL